LLSDKDYLEELRIITDELIDQYANEELPVDEREPIKRFILASGERRQKLRFAIALRRRASEAARERRHSRTRLMLYLPIAAGLLITVAIGVWLRFYHRSDVDSGLTALRMAYRDQRPVDARVSDFNYAPTTRGEQTIDSLQRGLAGSLLQRAASDHPDASSLHAVGQYYLTEHLFAQAAKQFEDSLKLEPKNAKAHNDLGVALLELGKQAEADNDPGSGFRYFAQSQGELDKALQLDPSLLEARFNLGLVFEKLSLPQDAENRWREYLEKDSTSQWANEARQRLRALDNTQQETTTLTRWKPSYMPTKTGTTKLRGASLVGTAR
jgi:tetratricopeptide (TPR) repeat protein